VPGKSPKEAIDNFAQYFKESLSCVTAGWVTAFQESRNLYKITCDPPAKLTKRSGGNLFIIATQVLTAVPDPNAEGQFKAQLKAKTREYSYRLVEEENIAALVARPMPGLIVDNWSAAFVTLINLALRQIDSGC
jgi:hypothetical protein